MRTWGDRAAWARANRGGPRREGSLPEREARHAGCVPGLAGAARNDGAYGAATTVRVPGS
ncbi:MAG: hypothetical protein U0841_30425 [Chloroflexia bacterium]